ncbi:MAG: hypothetical protein HY319_16825 [Armatimonadetes bacterium]|nr:hypothetical protein [Armatimonadota bacterium]
MVEEHAGRAVLRRVFEEAGFAVVEDYLLPIAGTMVRLDGFDPDRRTGYEYITTADGDREELHERIVAELDRLNANGELRLLLVDEQFIPDADTLMAAARVFLGLDG